MNIEIKFREFVNGKFHYWGFLEEGIFKGPVTPSLTRGKHSRYTGLKDKNGREIYEGDIIKVWEPDDTDSVNIGEVYWADEYPAFSVDGEFFEDLEYNTLQHATQVASCEVIGNIYENPELLKSQSIYNDKGNQLHFKGGKLSDEDKGLYLLDPIATKKEEAKMYTEKELELAELKAKFNTLLMLESACGRMYILVGSEWMEVDEYRQILSEKLGLIKVFDGTRYIFKRIKK